MIYARYRSAARSVLTRSIVFREAFADARPFTLYSIAPAYQVQSSVEETPARKLSWGREGGRLLAHQRPSPPFTLALFPARTK